MGNRKYQGGGTPKGVKKPHRRYTKETEGLADPGGADAFSDVGRACMRFFRERMALGLMTEKEALPSWNKRKNAGK